MQSVTYDLFVFCFEYRFKSPFELINHFRNPNLDHNTKIKRLAGIRVSSVQKAAGRLLGEAFAMR